MWLTKVSHIFKNSCNISNVSSIRQNSSFEKSLNKVQLLGRVGCEPQKRGSEERPVVTFSLATHVNFKNEHGEFNQKTAWHRICIFKPGLTNVAFNYIRKGQRVFISGSLLYSELKDDSGQPRTVTSILADEIIFLQGAAAENESSSEAVM